jgi:hypothetical protein
MSTFVTLVALFALISCALAQPITQCYKTGGVAAATAVAAANACASDGGITPLLNFTCVSVLPENPSAGDEVTLSAFGHATDKLNISRSELWFNVWNSGKLMASTRTRGCGDALKKMKHGDMLGGLSVEGLPCTIHPGPLEMHLSTVFFNATRGFYDMDLIVLLDSWKTVLCLTARILL